MSARVRLAFVGLVALASTGCRKFANTRYSRRDRINGANVRGLRLVSSQKTNVVRGHEAAPLAVLLLARDDLGEPSTPGGDRLRVRLARAVRSSVGRRRPGASSSFTS